MCSQGQRGAPAATRPRFLQVPALASPWSLVDLPLPPRTQAETLRKGAGAARRPLHIPGGFLTSSSPLLPWKVTFTF